MHQSLETIGLPGLTAVKHIDGTPPDDGIS